MPLGVAGECERKRGWGSRGVERKGKKIHVVVSTSGVVMYLIVNTIQASEPCDVNVLQSHVRALTLSSPRFACFSVVVVGRRPWGYELAHKVASQKFLYWHAVDSVCVCTQGTDLF